jgi:gamma-glutamyltranspeptidase/glutathione hydrolase
MHRLRFLAGAAVFLFLSGCSLFGDSSTAPSSSAGLVVGDEPYAVRAGAAALAQGGSAADAATAIYFALTVTYPVAAGLGGGGLCIVHDPMRAKNEAIDFLARDAAGHGAYAVPGAVAGFALLQSTYGKLPWQRVVSPGEGYAAAGFPISHALAQRLTASQDVVRLDAGLAAEFLDESGSVKAAGTIVSSPALGQTLSAIRAFGPNGFYRGRVADAIVAYSGAQGGVITAADLEAYAPGRGAATAMNIAGQTIYVPPKRVGTGVFMASLLSQLVDAQGNVTAGDNLTSSVASATKRSLDDFHIASLPRDLGATGFAATDGEGQAVACAVAMNGPFGSGHTAENTGVTLARAPSSGDAGYAAGFLTPVVATTDQSLSLVGAGAGGPNGAAAIAYALLKLAGGADITRAGELHSTGIAPYDTVNIIACQSGTCAAVPDPGAQGLGASGGN